MVYMPSVLTVGFYFERWRALAMGLALCGSGVGTFVFAPLTDALIDGLGWRITLVVHAGTIVLFIILKFKLLTRPQSMSNLRYI